MTEDMHAEPPTDEALLASFAAGEADALACLARRHERSLLGVALGLTGSRELAEEAVQDAWVRVIRSARTFHGRSNVRTWMYRIVINRSRDIRKREARRPVRKGPAPRVEGLEPDAACALRAALDELPVVQREALLLCHHAEVTHAQAAEILDVPLGTLKSRVRDAKRRLASKLRAEVGP